MGSPDPPGFRTCATDFFDTRCRLEFVSAVTERGSYPFPFRTRKSSPSSPMVPGPRARESRSPLDSRGPSPNGGGPPRFYRPFGPYAGRQPWPGLTLAITTGQYRSLMAHGALRQKRRGAPFFIYRPASFRSHLEVAKGRRLGRLTPAARGSRPPKQQLEGPSFLHTVPSRGCLVRDSLPEAETAGSASAARNLTQEKGRRPSHCEGLHGVGFWRYS